jgi:hypothetical protein
MILKEAYQVAFHQVVRLAHDVSEISTIGLKEFFSDERTLKSVAGKTVWNQRGAVQSGGNPLAGSLVER